MTKIEKGDLVCVAGNDQMPAQIIWRGQNEGEDAVYIRRDQGVLATVDSINLDIITIILSDGRTGWTIREWISKIEQEEQ